METERCENVALTYPTLRQKDTQKPTLLQRRVPAVGHDMLHCLLLEQQQRG